VSHTAMIQGRVFLPMTIDRSGERFLRGFQLISRKSQSGRYFAMRRLLETFDPRGKIPLACRNRRDRIFLLPTGPDASRHPVSVRAGTPPAVASMHIENLLPVRLQAP
jgi:hypothetical protein